MSNGTSQISFRDPETFEINHTIQVTWDGQPVPNINELECVGKEILQMYGCRTSSLASILFQEMYSISFPLLRSLQPRGLTQMKF